MLKEFVTILSNYFYFFRLRFKNFIKKSSKFLPLIFIILVHIFWIFSDNSAAPWDESRHARNALRIFQALRGENSLNIFFDVLFFYDFYTHFAYFIAAIFFFIFGVSYDSACLSVSLFWMPILYFSIYGIAKRLFERDEFRSILAAFIVTSFPIITGLGRVFLLDIPAVAAVAFCLYILMKNNMLLSKKSWKTTGIVIALAFYTKSHSLIFIIWFLIIAFFRGINKILKRKVVDSKRFLNNFLLAGLLSFGLIMIWTGANWGAYKDGLRSVSYLAGVGEGDPFPFSLKSIIYYPQKFLYDYLFLPLLFFFFSGIVSLFIIKNRKKLLLLGSFIIPYLWMTFLTYNKDARYLIPLLVFTGLIIVFPFSKNFRKRWFGFITLFLLISISSYNIIAINFGNLLKLPELKVLSIPILKNSSHVASSPNIGVKYNLPNMVTKFFPIINEIKSIDKNFPDDSTVVSCVIELEGDFYMDNAHLDFYSKLNQARFNRIKPEEIFKPVDMFVLTGKNVSLKEKYKEYLSFFEINLPSGNPACILLHDSYTNWTFFYDQINGNIFGFKFKEIFFKNSELKINMFWLSHNRIYGDIDGEVYFVNQGRTNKVYLQNFIPQGDDGKVWISRIIKTDLRKGEYNIFLKLKVTWFKDIVGSPIVNVFGYKKFEELKYLIPISHLRENSGEVYMGKIEVR